MKIFNYGFFLAAATFMLVVTNCSTPSGGVVSNQPDYSTMNSLADILRTKGGVEVMGSGNNVKVLIRGVSTIQLETQPLYVINGAPMGTSYSMANNAINVKDVVSVDILKDASATAIYGSRGANGVVIIETKRGDN